MSDHFNAPETGTDSEGQDLCRLTESVLDPRELEALVEDRGAGAVCTFVGVVRDHNLGRQVDHLIYEAYPEMAVPEMQRILDTALERWPGSKGALAHRLGRLEIGEASVIAVASHAHRAQAFEACRYLIDTLKARVPIWKKEIWSDGETWIDGEAPAPMQNEGNET